MQNRLSFGGLVAAAVLAVIASGCASEGSSSATSSSTTVAPTTSVTSTTEAAVTTTEAAVPTGWAPIRSGEQVCQLVNVDEVAATIGTPVVGDPKADATRPRCTLKHEGGQILVSFLKPDSYGPITPAEAMEVERQRFLQQHYDDAGAPDLGDAALLLHFDEVRNVVMVLVGEEVLMVDASFDGVQVVDDTALLDIARQVVLAIGATGA